MLQQDLNPLAADKTLEDMRMLKSIKASGKCIIRSEFLIAFPKTEKIFINIVLELFWNDTDSTFQ
eukprot:snap_masked-scaffold_12-processed-gene-7.18-mRNA-1 protein AED:1.00 eAED:1.00 QI:0/0/0/0/1/1/2/0/64